MAKDPPRQYFDKFLVPFLAGECGPEERPELVCMYNHFAPKVIAQGLPPAKAAERDRWIDKLLASSWNFLAWREERVIGHSAMLPNLDKSDAEYIVFVLPSHQNRGLGTVLTCLALDTARSRGIRKVWLTVERINFAAISLYKKAGFQFCDEDEDEVERFMELKL